MLGVEPAANVAEAARPGASGRWWSSSARGPGRQIAAEHGRADLVDGNNVFAHVPDIRGFAAGLRALVKDTGLVTLEFPHLLRLIERRQYDTIYHEHFSYLSLLTVNPGAADGRAARGRRRRTRHSWRFAAGLRATRFLRIRRRRSPQGAAASHGAGEGGTLKTEEAAGLHTIAGHRVRPADVLRIKSDLLEFLLAAARDGKSVAGDGAPGKGNTLLNHCGIRTRSPGVHRGPEPG